MLFRSRQTLPYLLGDYGSRGRYSATWGTLLERDPELRTVYVTVDLWIGDRNFKVARTAVSFTSSSLSRTYRYLPALIEEPELKSAISLFQQTAQARTVTVQIAAAALGQPTSFLTHGPTLGGVAEVRLLGEGMDYDAGLVWMRGEVTAVDVDPKTGGAVQVQIADMRATQAAAVPETATDADRWPTAPDGSIGLRYPLIINGYPKVPAVLVAESATVPAYLYAGRGPQPIQEDAVYVNGEVTGETYADAEEQDGLGTLARTIRFSTGTWATSDTVYVDTSISSGATLGPVELLQHLLATYTGFGRQGLNLETFSRAQSKLRAAHPKVLINSSGDEGVDVLQYAEGTYLKSLPMLHLMYAGAGLGVACVDRRIGPGRRHVDAVLVGGRMPLIDRETDYVESSRDERYNSFELRYNYDAMLGEYASVLQYDESNSRICALSQRFDGGRREAETLDSPIIHSDALANTVMGWLIAHRAVPYYTVTWSVYPYAAIRLQQGMTVLYTDPDRSEFTATPALVTETNLKRGGGSSISLAVWHPRWTQAMWAY